MFRPSVELNKKIKKNTYQTSSGKEIFIKFCCQTTHFCIDIFHKNKVFDYLGSSLHTWDLTHRLSSYTSGLKTIDDDLSYLYGQLPGKIRGAATAVMEKAERKVQTDVFVAGINVLGTALG